MSDILEKAKKCVSGAAEMIEAKYTEMSENASIRKEKRDAEAAVDRAYLQLGKKYYEIKKDSPEEDDVSLFAAIQAGLAKIDSCNKSLNKTAFCPNCGAEVTKEQLFCAKCGTQLKDTASANENYKSSEVIIEEEQKTVIPEMSDEEEPKDVVSGSAEDISNSFGEDASPFVSETDMSELDKK